MPKEKDRDFDESTLDDVQGMVSKWISIPFGILVVMVAGACVNLVPYFLELKGDLGFTPAQQELVRWAVLGGYYGGVLAGPVSDWFGQTFAFAFSAIVALGGFIGLAFYTDAGNVGTFNQILIIALLATVAFGGAVATIAAISTVIKNFSRNVGSQLVAVMIAYYFVAPEFDQAVRHGYFEDAPLKTVLITAGITQFIAYLLAAFIVKDNEMSNQMKKASDATDTFGVLLFAIVEGAFLAAIYFTVVIADNYKIAIMLMIILILVNFILLGFAIQMLLGRIKGTDTKNVVARDSPNKKHLGEMLIQPEYWCLLVGTFIVVGAGQTYLEEAPTVGAALGSEHGESVIYAFWLSDAATRLAGGLLAAYFVSLINGYLFAALAAFGGMVGFGLVFLAEPWGPFFFYLSSFFVGASVGGWWVIVPQIILDDAGPKSFETLWGLTLTVNVAGFFAFEKLFMWINEKTEPGEVGTCSGHSCFLVPYVASAGLCLVAGLLALVGYANDTGTGGSDEKKSLRKNDANGGGKERSDSKSSDKKGKRGKSSDKKKKDKEKK